jgi:hypothetical protein
MPKFKFLGTEACPEEITLRDVVFVKGNPVDVSDTDFIAKLSRLDYFAEVKAGRPKKDE